LGPEADFGPRKLASTRIAPPRDVALHIPLPGIHEAARNKGPYVPAPYLSSKTFGPFAIVQKSHGFIPNFFRAQTLRPDLLEAELEAVDRILLPEDVLTRVQKECILLAVSAANLNSYCVAMHCNLLRGLGMPSEEGDQIAVDHHESNLSESDRALLDFAVKLGTRVSEFSRKDVVKLQTLGFTEEQILECEVVTALNNFANTLQMGLGIEPDFEPPPDFENKVHLSGGAQTPIQAGGVVHLVDTLQDTEAGLVAQAQSGKLEAFEELARHHGQLIQRLRRGKHFESLDEAVCNEERDFRPRQVRAWQDNPEELYSKSEMRQLVERGILALPANYRVVVMLRDIQQLSTDEVGRQLGLSVPAVKTRLLRGRLMLREWLSPHFANRLKGIAQ
jgi:uncharacterized peroxidase-related enzyme